MKNDIKSKVGNIIFYVLMAILLVTGLSAKANNEIPSFLGYSFMHVISPSMEDTIMTDDIAIGKKVLPTDEITVGDVYIYENISGLKIIHRIIEQNDDGTYKFKGDNNAIADYMPVYRNQIEFKYLFRIPYLGYLVKLFKNVYFYAILIASFLALEILGRIKKKNEIETPKN